MAENTPVAVIREMFAALDRGDFDRVNELIADEVVLEFAGNPSVVGRDAFNVANFDFMNSIAGIQHELDRVLAVHEDPTVVVATLKVHYERHDGRRLSLPCVNVFRILEGRVSEYRVFMNLRPVYNEETP